jgi:hypothetical protein
VKDIGSNFRYLTIAAKVCDRVATADNDACVRGVLANVAHVIVYDCNVFPIRVGCEFSEELVVEVNGGNVETTFCQGDGLNAVTGTEINGELIRGGSDLVGFKEISEIENIGSEVSGHLGVDVTEVIVVVGFYVHR